MKRVFLLLAFIFVSCHNEKLSNIDTYVSKNLLTNTDTNQLFVFIPTDACHGCINNLINHLNVIEKQHITPVFVAKTKKETMPFVKNLSHFYQVKYVINNPKMKDLINVEIVIYRPEKGYSDYEFDGSNDYKIINVIDNFVP